SDAAADVLAFPPADALWFACHMVSTCPKSRGSRSRRPPGAGHGDNRSGLLLLPGDRLGLALAGARIGMRALAADGQALAMAQTAIAGEIHQALDVHRRIAAQVAFYRVVGIDGFADLQHFLIGQVLHAAT